MCLFAIHISFSMNYLFVSWFDCHIQNLAYMPSSRFQLEKAMAPHSSTLAWKIPWTESLVGCRPWGHKESDTTERLHFHFSLSCIEEGNGNPLQCSCLENPRDGRAWWATIYGVAQSRTRLKQLSSSRISTCDSRKSWFMDVHFWISARFLNIVIGEYWGHRGLFSTFHGRLGSSSFCIFFPP